MAKISIREAYNFNFNFVEPIKKEALVLSWLIGFREYLLKNKIANYGDIMPNKKDISNSRHIPDIFRLLISHELFPARNYKRTAIGNICNCNDNGSGDSKRHI